MGIGAFYLMLTAAVGRFTISLRHGLQMIGDKRYRAAWVWYLERFLPIAGAAQYWAATSDASAMTRNIILGLTGAAVGCCTAIALGYGVRNTAANAQPPSAAPSNPPPVINVPNNQGIFTYGQQSNNYVTNDPRAWGFTQDQGNRFANSIRPSDRRIVVATRLDDLLSRSFRDQLVKLIRSVPGWEVRDFGDHVTNTLGVRGIILKVPNPEQPSPQAKILMDAFLASGIQPSPIFAGPWGDAENPIQIVVGSPP